MDHEHGCSSHYHAMARCDCKKKVDSVPPSVSACGLTECAGKQACDRCDAQARDGAPTEDDAYLLGANGSPAHEGERLAFEAWMAGHCWALCATWTGSGYIGKGESVSEGRYVCRDAMATRRMWAAWRDRAALARLKPPNVGIEPPKVGSNDGLGVLVGEHGER